MKIKQNNDLNLMISLLFNCKYKNVKSQKIERLKQEQQVFGH